MKNRRFTRVLLLVLTLSLVVTAVVGASASNYVGDINDDGKITALDAQLMAEAKAGYRELTDKQQKASGKGKLAEVIDFILGREVDTVGKEYFVDKIAIYTAQDLQKISENLTGDYRLAEDIDLGGAQWTPIRGFAGTFDGNGHTISNLTICDNSLMQIGFFTDTTLAAEIQNLALRNVTLNAGGKNQFIGLAVGTSRGTLTDVTITGTINDSRTQIEGGTTDAESIIYTGVLVGRTVKDSGIQTGGTSITVTDDTGTHKVEGLCADVKLNIQKDSQLVNHNGLYGYLYSGTSVTGQWRDNTHNASNVSQTMQDRQQQVVDYMNAMATVAWQVPETMTYNVGLDHTQVFEPGVTYYGLPYNGRNGGLERFMSCMDQVDGVNMATTRYGTVCTKNDDMGWYSYMGNDCSGAVAWAWMQVSPNRAVGSSESECAGGAYTVTTEYMVPTNQIFSVPDLDDNGNFQYNDDGTMKMEEIIHDNQGKRGIYPVGEWTTNTQLDSDGWLRYDDIVGEFAYNVPVYTAAVMPGTADFLTFNGKVVNSEETMMEAYAITRKADAIVGGKPNGHTRLVVSYPVTIRNADGTIDGDKSFLVCTEQGDGIFDRNAGLGTSTWRINYRWSYNNLLAKDSDSKLDVEDGNPTTGTSYCRWVYLPITIRALRNDNVKYAYVDEATKVESPVIGKTYTNWRTVTSTIIVTDMNGNELFRNTAFTGVDKSGAYYYRGQGLTVDLNHAHGAAFNAFAQKNLTAGQTYKYSVQLLLSNGETLVVNRDSLHWKQNGHSGAEFDTFTYNP